MLILDVDLELDEILNFRTKSLVDLVSMSYRLFIRAEQYSELY